MMERQEAFFRIAAAMGESFELQKASAALGMLDAIKREQMIKDAIIGSTILDFKYEKIPNRKNMYEMTIKTDAPKVMITDRAYMDISELKVRVKR